MTALSVAALIVYSSQILLLVTTIDVACRLFRRADPQDRIVLWRAVVLMCVALPFVPPLRAFAAAVGDGAPMRQFVLTISAAAGADSRFGFNAVAAVLVLGIALRAGILGVALAQLRRMRRESAPLPSESALQELARSITPRVDVRCHPTITQPVTFGLRSPVVLVPQRLLQMPDEVQRGAVLHEAFHVARRDWPSLVAERAVEAVFWFHPAIWWALDQIQLAREQRVDDLVVHQTGERQTYMKTLLSFGDMLSASPLAAGFLRRRHLARRIGAIAANRRSLERSRLAVAVLIAVAVLSSVAVKSLVPLVAEQRVYESKDGVTLPVAVTKVDPKYTAAAMEAKIQGTVLLSCVVNTSGVPENVSVVQSLDTTYGLDDEALGAVQQWRFNPGTKDGEPVPVRVDITIRFTLRD